jgi:flagellar protein FliO/FliZ
MAPVIRSLAIATIVLLVIASWGAQGSETALSPLAGDEPVTPPVLARLVLGLVVVLAGLGAVAWVLRRVSPRVWRGAGDLRVLGGVAVGSRERVVLIQVGSRKLLLGVTPGRLATLLVMDAPALGQDETESEPGPGPGAGQGVANDGAGEPRGRRADSGGAAQTASATGATERGRARV